MSLNIRENSVMVEIACNDPDNGCFAGIAQQIEIGQQFIELEASRAAPRFLELSVDCVRLAGKKWPITGSKYGIGNWCWNGYWMKIPVAVEFLCWLHGRKLFDISCAELRVFNMWKSDKPFDDQDRKFLDRLLGKPSFHEFSK